MKNSGDLSLQSQGNFSLTPDGWVHRVYEFTTFEQIMNIEVLESKLFGLLLHPFEIFPECCRWVSNIVAVALLLMHDRPIHD